MTRSGVSSTSRGRGWAAACLLLALAFLGPVLAAQATPAAGPLPLLATADRLPGQAAPADDPAYTRARYVAVNLGALLFSPAGAPARPRATVRLNLYPEIDLTAVLDRTDVTADGSFNWIGHLEGVDLSQVVLVVRNGLLAGTITTPDARYTLLPAADALHVVNQVDQSAFPPEAEPLMPELDAIPGGLRSLAADDGSLIDVLVVYTPASASEVGGLSAMLTLIDLAMAETNAAYANSGVRQRLRLVKAAEMSYAESGDFSTDLTRLRQVDGYMDEVHTLRDAYGADVVSLIVKRGSLCGLAYLMSPASTSFASAAFSVVAHNCAVGYYSFGHELGHLMGSQHDQANASMAGAYSYSYGFQDPGDVFRTIMAYDCASSCTRIQYFSNPAVAYSGQPTGVDAADNATSLNNTALIVANFRANVVVIDPTPTATPESPRLTPTVAQAKSAFRVLLPGIFR